MKSMTWVAMVTLISALSCQDLMKSKFVTQQPPDLLFTSSSPAPPMDTTLVPNSEVFVHASSLTVRAACRDDAPRLRPLTAGQKLVILEVLPAWIRIRTTDTSKSGCIKNIENQDYLQTSPADPLEYRRKSEMIAYKRAVAAKELTLAHNWAKRSYALKPDPAIETLVLFTWARRYQAMLREGSIMAGSPAPTQAVILAKKAKIAGGAETAPNLWSICEEHYKDPYLWVTVWYYNFRTIGKNPNVLYPGQKIELPPIRELLAILEEIYRKKFGNIHEFRFEKETELVARVSQVAGRAEPAMTTVDTKQGDSIEKFVQLIIPTGPSDPVFRVVEALTDGLNFVSRRANGVPKLSNAGLQIAIFNLPALGITKIPEGSPESEVEAEIVSIGETR